MKNIDELHHEHILAEEAERLAFKNLTDKICSELAEYEIDFDPILIFTDSAYRVEKVNLLYERYDLCKCKHCGKWKEDATDDGDQVCEDCRVNHVSRPQGE